MDASFHEVWDLLIFEDLRIEVIAYADRGDKGVNTLELSGFRIKKDLGLVADPVDVDSLRGSFRPSVKHSLMRNAAPHSG